MAEEITAGGITVPLTHPDKVLFPGDGITKADLARYHADVAGAMLPWISGRPVSMVRYPDGLDGERFFQKNAPAYFPRWIRRVTVGKEGGEVGHVVCDKPATLVYLANQACIEIHAFTSRADRPEVPDQVVFDFDPPDGERFAAVRRAARPRAAAAPVGLRCGARVHSPGGRRAGPQAPGRHHHRAAQGQAGDAHLRRRHAECLRPDRGGQLWSPGPAGRARRHPAELGRSRGRPAGSWPVHDGGGTRQDRRRPRLPGSLGRLGRRGPRPRRREQAPGPAGTLAAAPPHRSMGLPEPGWPACRPSCAATSSSIDGGSPPPSGTGASLVGATLRPPPTCCPPWTSPRIWPRCGFA